VSPDIVFQDLEPGDAILMCSDGLSGMITDEDIATLMQGVSKDTLPAVATKLIEQAKENGGKDNVTVIVGVMEA
ncbi:MAG: hypothetical protein HQL53_14325, partial [Magnetococcales bacterium]|nr:hypothetical protein [Magnetococcales bacterium]